VLVHVLQGEHDDARLNESVGEFMLEGLDEDADEGNEILVRFHLNLDGILDVTAVERDTGLEKAITIDNAITQFRAKNFDEARSRLAAVFNESPDQAASPALAAVKAPAAEASAPAHEAAELLSKARRLAADAPEEDADEMHGLIEQLQQAISQRAEDRIEELRAELEDLMFYLEDA
jgi:molecular chaperone DnaK (HSP70)